jgi:hypothetical protein
MYQGVMGQGAGTPPAGSQRIAGSLGQNHPNPFNPTTTIPFAIGLEGDPPVCKDPARRHVVSLRIYDVLSKPVANPVLQGGGDKGGQPIERMTLACGDYNGFWDGTLRGTTQKVPSGPYIYVLEVDGKATSRKMFVAK